MCEIFHDDGWVRIIHGDALKVLRGMPSESVDCVITSPPYWGLRDYGEEAVVEWPDGWKGQLGSEPTSKLYIEHLLMITAELRRVLRKTGVMFWNHGDCYGRERDKCLALQNFRLILRMVDEQCWILRNIIIWHKIRSTPESVKDRFTNTYEPVFMLVKDKKYWFDLDTVREPPRVPIDEAPKRFGRLDPERKGAKFSMEGMVKYQRFVHPLGKNPGDVWQIAPANFMGNHFAVFPEKLVERCIKAGCPKGGLVLDPFAGSGTTGAVAKRLGRKAILIEIVREYCEMARERVAKETPALPLGER